MKLTILLISILLIGCTRTEYIKETIYINNTIEINKTIEIPCNLTCPKPEINTTVYSRDYVLGLIRQLDFHENQQSLYFNDSECNWELNKTKNELKDCEEINCEYNSSWC